VRGQRFLKRRSLVAGEALELNFSQLTNEGFFLIKLNRKKVVQCLNSLKMSVPLCKRPKASFKSGASKWCKASRRRYGEVLRWGKRATDFSPTVWKEEFCEGDAGTGSTKRICK